MMSNAMLLAKLRDEVLTTLRIYRHNIAELQWLLQYLGDVPAALLHEWDWQWPWGAEWVPPREEHFCKREWRRFASSALCERIDRLYTLLADLPPNLTPWEEDWDSSQSLLVFLATRLASQTQATLSLGRFVAEEIDRLTAPSSPSPTSERR
jgi:hypothetical protein